MEPATETVTPVTETVTPVTETETSINHASASASTDKSGSVVPHTDSVISENPNEVRNCQNNSRSAEKSCDATPTTQEVFRISRPLIVKSKDKLTSRSNKLVPEQSLDNTMTTNCRQMNIKKSLNAKPRNIQTDSCSSNGKWSGYRNKQSLIPCNSHNAILLPRPQIANAALPEAHIQRIPVLNNTQFQLPKNLLIDTESSLPFLPRFVKSNVSDNGNLHLNHTNVRSTVEYADGTVNKKPRLTSNVSEAVCLENTFNLGKNDSSRVRNTREDSKTVENSANMAEDKQMSEGNCQKMNTLNSDLIDNANIGVKEMCNREIKCKPLEQNFTKNDEINSSVCPSVILASAVQKESCPKLPGTTNVQNGKSSSKTVVSDFITKCPSTNQSFTEELPHQCDAFKDEVQKDVIVPVSVECSTTSILEPENSNIFEKTKTDCKTNSTENIIYKDADEGEFRGCDSLSNSINKEAVVDRTMTTPSSKKRKRPHRVNKKSKYAAKDDDDDKEKCKKSYIVKNESSHKKQKGKELSVKHIQSKQPFLQNSKAYQDIESRYMGHDLTGSTSVEKVFEERCDIINKVESEKLSKVKDHHLLKLSDKEREYLRNKCYLDNDLTVDVRRRFEEQTGSKNDTVTGAPQCNIDGNETVNKDVIRKETSLLSGTKNSKLSSGRNTDQNPVVSEASTSFASKRKAESTNDKEQLFKLHLKPPEKEKQIGGQTVGQCQSSVSLEQPVVRLQCLDCIPNEKQGLAVENSEKPRSIHINQHIANFPTTSKKVYYVVNSSDISRFKNPAGSANSVTDLKNKISASPASSSPDITHTIGPINMTINTTMCQSSTNNKQFPADLMHKISTTSSSNVAVSDNQLEPEQELLLHKMENHTLKLAQNNVAPPKTYSSKLTVKRLLEAKRDNRKNNVVISRQMDGKSKQAASFPVQLYGRAMFGGSFKATVETSKLEGTSGNTEILPNGLPSNTSAVVSSSSSGNPVSSSSSSLVHQYIYQNGIQTQTGRNVNIVNPVLIPISKIQRTLISSASLFSLPSMTRKPDTLTPSEINSSISTSTLSFQSGSEKRKPVYIKIGEQTMIVKRSEDKSSTKRKTLPAPKPKRTIADDYKRKHRRSRGMFIQRGHHISLRTKLRKLLKRSDKSVHKLMNSLDLVPVDLLKQFTDTKVKKDSSESEFDKSCKEMRVNEIKETTKVPTEDGASENISREQKSKVFSNPTNMANVVQISKHEDGSVNYSIQQMQVLYRKPGSTKFQRSFRHLGFSCRLQFSADGIIEKIYIESLQRGLYLLENVNGNKAKLTKKRKLNTSLVPYPPHIATIPSGSLCIAVGDIYPEEQKSQYIFETESKDIHSIIDRFLRPCAMQNMHDFIDKRYSSITDQSMSPRCSSPMFYSEEMRDAFDFFEGSFDCSSKGLPVAKRSETSFAKHDIQTRFSERAMALKIKQNELFESCRKLKSEQPLKEGYKKKREKILHSNPSRTEITKRNDDGGVRILSHVRDIFNGEEPCCVTTTYPCANDTNDNNPDVDVK
ncbi:uncharacterized protein LOC123523005 isoform X2 [Mercenaria mercenaria]|nr:uncharacterized protein LOC123523005 isoform X2 [Mercenaria mercenaria]